MSTTTQSTLRVAPDSSPRALFFALLSMAIATAASAQDLTVKAPPQAMPITITNVTVHPISAPEIPYATITFDHGSITGVYTLDQWKQHQAGTTRELAQGLFIDGTGKHVYPGMIAADTQLGLQEFGLIAQTIDTSELGAIKPEVLAATAVNPDSTLLPVTRSNGILTAAIFPEGGVIPGRPCAIRMDGWTTEDLALIPRGFASGRSPAGGPESAPESSKVGEDSTGNCTALPPPSPALGLAVNWPSTRTYRAWWMDQSEEEQQKNNREALERVTTAFDTAAAYIAAKDADPTLPTDLRWEAMRAVLPPTPPPGGRALGGGLTSSPAASMSHPPIEATSAPLPLPLFISANDLDQITAAVTFCKERHLRMVLVGGREAELCADLLKDNHIPVIIGGTHSLPAHDDSAYDECYTLPARLNAAGVQFCIASADRTAHERNLPYNAAMAVAYGLPMDAAIKSVTLAPAQVLGLGDQLGSLELGKRATLIVTTGNPLEVTTQIEAAFIDGRRIDLSNKQTKLYDKYRERYEQLGQIKDEYKTKPAAK